MKPVPLRFAKFNNSYIKYLGTEKAGKQMYMINKKTKYLQPMIGSPLLTSLLVVSRPWMSSFVKRNSINEQNDRRMHV